MTVLGDICVVDGPGLSAQQLHDLLRLRVSVFVVEQQCAYDEVDGRDMLETTRHMWREDSIGVAVAVRVLDVGLDSPIIGRVVTRRDCRGQALARPLVERAHDQFGGEAGTVLDAQLHLADWYEKMGWTRVADPFVEDGIDHVRMRRR